MLAFFAWRTPESMLAASVAPPGAITYILAPPRALPPPKLPPPRVVAKPALRPDPGRAQTTPSPEVLAAPPLTYAPPQAITQTPPPPDPFAEPAPKPGGDLKQRSLQSAALIDKQMRKESWNPRDKKIANDTSSLAARIGSAYAGGGTTMEEVTTADGRVMTRVRSPGGGTYCAYKESNAVTGGRDPFRDGIKTKVATCP